MYSKLKISVIKVISLIMLITCLILCGSLIILTISKSRIEIVGKNTEKLIKNYISTEDTSTTNTWDISATENDNVIATLSDDGILTISGTGNMKDWNNGSTTDWHGMNDKLKTVVIENGVTNIGKRTFLNCKSLINIEIPDTVISIGDEAFGACYNLIEIELPNSITSIGNNAFSDCYSLIRIELPNSLTRIENSIFSNCKSLRIVKLEDNITCIGNYAFKNCEKLTSIEIPEGVTAIGEFAFRSCTSLKKIKVNDNNANYKDINGVLYTKDGTEIIKYPEGKTEKKYTLFEGVTSIKDFAFYDCKNLTCIELPKSMTSVGMYPFRDSISLIDIIVDKNNTNYKDVNGVLYTKDGTEIIKYPEGRKEIEYKILDGVNYIGHYAFFNCEKLEGVELPKSLISIGDFAFDNCKNLTKIDLPNNLESIGHYAFTECNSLTDIEIPSSVTSIGGSAFRFCTRLTTINIPNSVTSIGAMTFERCASLTNVEIGEGVKNIGQYAFYGCESLININIPDSVTRIENNAFGNCNVTKLIEKNNSIEIPNILKRIQDENDILYSSGGLELNNCSIENDSIKIINVNVPAKLKVIDGNLESLVYKVSINSWDISATEDDNVIATLSDDGLLTISGTGDMKNWESDSITDWHDLTSKVKNIIIEKGVTNIGNRAFENCYRLTSIEIAESVTNIGNESLVNCIYLTNIEVDPDNMNYKDENGVLYTKDETKIIKYPGGKRNTEYQLLGGVTSIGEYAFEECNNLTIINLSESIINIEKYAFTQCYNLTTINLPKSITSIEDYAFNDCHDLKSIMLPETLTNIGKYVFLNANDLTVICYKGTTSETYVRDNYLKYTIIIKGINPKTTVKQLKNKLENDTNYEVINLEGQIISENDIVETACKLIMPKGVIYTLIVTGDCTGDGQADIKDIMNINKYRLNIITMEEEYILAANVNNDTNVDIKDIMKINKYRLGMITEL